jgi:hypothetical protein
VEARPGFLPVHPIQHHLISILFFSRAPSIDCQFLQFLFELVGRLESAICFSMVVDELSRRCPVRQTLSDGKDAIDDDSIDALLYLTL